MILPLVPHENRAAIASLWQLEARLVALCFAGKEPALRQIRLAWWRDALATLDAPQARAPDEPLLRDIAEVLVPKLPRMQLAHHADQWLTALGSGWSANDVMTAGQSIFGITATLLGGISHPSAGCAYALMQTALLVDDVSISEQLTVAAAAIAPMRGQVRPLVVLDRLSVAIARRSGRRSRAREQALILRIGLFGR